MSKPKTGAQKRKENREAGVKESAKKYKSIDSFLIPNQSNLIKQSSKESTTALSDFSGQSFTGTEFQSNNFEETLQIEEPQIVTATENDECLSDSSNSEFDDAQKTNICTISNIMDKNKTFEHPKQFSHGVPFEVKAYHRQTASGDDIPRHLKNDHIQVKLITTRLLRVVIIQ